MKVLKLNTQGLLETSLGEVIKNAEELIGVINGSGGVFTPTQHQTVRQMACELNLNAATVACEVTNVTPGEGSHNAQ